MIKNLPAVQETWVPSLGQKDLLEKGMATQFSILAWEIPWTEEPGGLQSMDHRVRYNRATITFILSFPDGSVGKESACNAGNTGDMGLIPELGRSPGEGNPSGIMAWKILWTEEPERLQPLELQRAGHDRAANTHL